MGDLFFHKIYFILEIFISKKLLQVKYDKV